jgi:hypothetical protein
MRTSYKLSYSLVPFFLITASLSSAQTPPPKERKQSVGFRVRALPIGAMSVLGDDGAMTTTFTPVYDWHFRTTSRSPALSVGPALEFALGRRVTLSAELLFHRLRYDKVTSIFAGADDPNTGHDERARTTLTERTKARLWDVPVMLHYSLASAGRWSRFYVAGGAALRTVSKIRTTTETVNALAEKSTDTIASAPVNRNVYGAVIGVGFRFIDDFNVKSTPEVRFTRWSGRTFDLDTTRSPVNQLEIGIGFTF